MKYGVLGGTFDPPHLGHLNLALAARDQLSLDKVIFVPAMQNPFKAGIRPTPARHRLEMVVAMLENETHFIASNVEMTRPAPSYMYQTIEELNQVMPGEYWLILGADTLERFMEWKYADKILRHARLACAQRPGTDLDALREVQATVVQERTDFIELEPLDISATQVRKALGEGKAVDHLVHPEVLKYIRDHQLYKPHDK